ncbi:MAG: glucose-6-phosphate dehydrogenase [Sulfurifustis sp.]
MSDSIGPCYFVIFGATGNLAATQLLPALYALEAGGHLNEDLRLVAFARRDWGRDAWREHLRAALEERLGGRYDRAVCERLAARFDYLQGDLHDAAAYSRLMETLGQPRTGTCENIVFYLAIKPGDFADVVVNLDRAGINRRQGRHRIVIEKPFGEDLDSARALNALLHKYFDEEQIYRIDHYLGKETVQNLFVFRFANTLIEAVWNRSYVDHVQITVAEQAGIGTRADYYDRAGALRDMVQNHLMQLLAVVAMEPPARLEADALRDEKVKVLRSIRPIPSDDVDAYALRAQYRAGEIDGRTVPGYREEANVARGSTTETYVAAKLYIDNWRWRDVPFYLRTGKRLAHPQTLIGIRFRRPPQLLFGEASRAAADPNWVVLSIQPAEDMHIEIRAKQPGLGIQTRAVRLDAMYREQRGAPIEAYQTLLLDVIEGDRSLFIRFDEVEWAWRVVDPILRHWAKRNGDIPTYAAGTWGPEAADRLFDRDDQRWRNQV